MRLGVSQDPTALLNSDSCRNQEPGNGVSERLSFCIYVAPTCAGQEQPTSYFLIRAKGPSLRNWKQQRMSKQMQPTYEPAKHLSLIGLRDQENSPDLPLWCHNIKNKRTQTKGDTNVQLPRYHGASVPHPRPSTGDGRRAVPVADHSLPTLGAGTVVCSHCGVRFWEMLGMRQTPTLSQASSGFPNPA